jgi:hypothetical protein
MFSLLHKTGSPAFCLSQVLLLWLAYIAVALGPSAGSADSPAYGKYDRAQSSQFDSRHSGKCGLGY